MYLLSIYNPGLNILAIFKNLVQTYKLYQVSHFPAYFL